MKEMCHFNEFYSILIKNYEKETGGLVTHPPNKPGPCEQEFVLYLKNHKPHKIEFNDLIYSLYKVMPSGYTRIKKEKGFED